MARNIFFLLVALIFVPQSAFSASCRLPDFGKAFKSSGMVVEASVVEHLDADKVLLKFGSAWKGIKPTQTEAIIGVGYGNFGDATKYIQPEIGTRYILFLDYIYENLPIRIHLYHCSRSGLYNEHKDIKLLNEYRSKIEALTSEVLASPKDSAPLLTKAKFLYDNHDFWNAEIVLQKLLQFEPNNFQGLLLISEVLYQNAKSQSELGRKDEIEIRKALKREKYEKALEFANRALKFSENDQRAMSVKIAVSLQLGEKINTDFSNLNLSDTRIEYQKFSDIQFENVDFSNTLFFGNKIENITIMDSNFSDGTIRLTKLSGVHVKKANFDNTYIDKATKKWAKQEIPFEETKIINSTFEKSSFVKARLILPIISSEIKDCNFNHASFEAGYGDGELVVMDNVNVINSDFSGVSVRHNSFKLGTIKNSKFTNVNFKDASVRAELINVDLSQAQLEQASFLGSMFDCKTQWPEGFDPIKYGASPIEKQCNGKPFAFHNFDEKEFKSFEQFGPVNFAGASFKNAKMYGVSLVGANLNGVDFTEADLRSADLRKANLEKASFNGLKVQRINFEDANLKGADFTGAYFERARLQGADLSGANFTDAKFVATNFEGATYDQDTIWPEGFNYKAAVAIPANNNTNKN